MKSEPALDWSELPADLLPAVFAKLGAAEVLMGAGLVCRAWREAARLPQAWRRIDMRWLPWGAHMKHYRHGVPRTKDPEVVRAMTRLAVDRSGGRVEVFAADGGFVTDELLKYVAERSVYQLFRCYYLPFLNIRCFSFASFFWIGHVLVR